VQNFIFYCNLAIPFRYIFRHNWYNVFKIAMENIGEKIKNLRIKNWKTQEQLADELCITQKTVSNIETGKTVPRMKMLEQIAAIFGMPFKNFLFVDEPAPPKIRTTYEKQMFPV